MKHNYFVQNSVRTNIFATGEDTKSWQIWTRGATVNNMILKQITEPFCTQVMEVWVMCICKWKKIRYKSVYNTESVALSFHFYFIEVFKLYTHLVFAVSIRVRF